MVGGGKACEKCRTVRERKQRFEDRGLDPSKAFGLKGQLVSQKPPVHRLPVPNSSPER